MNVVATFNVCRLGAAVMAANSPMVKATGSS
jgi:hypothetical protein